MELVVFLFFLKCGEYKMSILESCFILYCLKLSARRGSCGISNIY